MEYKLKPFCNTEIPFKLIRYSDAGWSSDRADQKFSTMKTKYVALSESWRERLWLQKHTDNFEFKLQKPTVVLEDNISCIDFITVDQTSRRSNRGSLPKTTGKGLVNIRYCPAESMVADIRMHHVAALRINVRSYRWQLPLTMSSNVGSATSVSLAIWAGRKWRKLRVNMLLPSPQ